MKEKYPNPLLQGVGFKPPVLAFLQQLDNKEGQRRITTVFRLGPVWRMECGGRDFRKKD